MAGLTNKTGGFQTFLTIFEGKFTKKVEPGTQDAITRINKNSKEVWELHYNALEDVYIRDIERKEHEEYGLSFVITLETDDGQSFGLQLPYSGRTTTGLMFRLPNLDISKPVTLIPSRFKEVINGVEKSKTYLTVHQFGEKVAPYWTKDNQGDLPQMEQVMRKGKMEWDDTKQIQYIEQMLEDSYKPYFAQLKENAPAKTAPPAAAPQKPAEPVKGTVTPMAAIADGHPLKVEYVLMCQHGYKNSIQEYEELKKDYLLDCEQGFAGTILDYERHLAEGAKTGTAKTQPPAEQAKPKPTPGPKTSSAPAPKTSAAPKPPQSDANFGGMKGASFSPMEKGFNDVKNNGYQGTLQDFEAYCNRNGLKPDHVMCNPQGQLEPQDLPF